MMTACRNWGVEDLLYTLLDFHPITAVFELCVFVTGPFYNRWLRRQLAALTDADLTLRPGESKSVIVGIRAVKQPPERLMVVIRSGGTEHEVAVSLSSGGSESVGT